ncbi:MAG: serine/threonine protein kinase [Cyanobacteria bacterium]|nr:serine/threonine protein kinase [Cyanobacteriota bacterium]
MTSEPENDSPSIITLPVSHDSDYEPETIGRYRVLCLIGEGGMGKVYKVEDAEIVGADTQVFALKIIKRDQAENLEALHRLEQEASVVSTLNHPNIVTIYGMEKNEECAPYIVMEYVGGASLERLLHAEEHATQAVRLRERPDLCFDIAEQICRAVHHAHEQGVVHRDLKPSNILIAYDASGIMRVKVVDFGIAKVLPSIADTRSGTCSAEIVGTAAYMSPEQCTGDRLDARSDIYSLGTVLYELFTGNPPFYGSSPVKTILQHLTDTPVPPTSLVEGQLMSEGLEAIILRCLEKEPAKRFSSAESLREALVSEWNRFETRSNKEERLLPAVAYYHNRQRVWLTYSAIGVATMLPAVFLQITIPSASLAILSPMYLSLGLFIYQFICALLQAKRTEQINELIKCSQPVNKMVVLRNSRHLGPRIYLVGENQLSRYWPLTNKGSNDAIPKHWLKKYFNNEPQLLPVYMDEERGEAMGRVLEGSLVPVPVRLLHS